MTKCKNNKKSRAFTRNSRYKKEVPPKYLDEAYIKKRKEIPKDFIQTTEEDEGSCTAVSTGQFDFKVPDIFQQLKNNREERKARGLK